MVRISPDAGSSLVASMKSYVGWEAVVIQNLEAYEIAGKKVDAAEVYPSSESWGRLGWTYCEYQEAYRKFKNLLRGR